MKSILLPVPSEGDQEAIAQAIDSKLTKVDALISNVQAQIEKLKAYKQSLITEVVTKGLDPTVPMKDSGVEWIGEIPDGWVITKAGRFIFNTQNGLTRRDLSESSGAIVLKMKNISADGVLDYNIVNRISLDDKEKNTYALQTGDILFVRVNGSKNLVGKCAVFEGFPELVAYNDHIIRVKLKSSLIYSFFKWYLLGAAGKTEIDQRTSTSAGQYTISGRDLKDIIMCVPSYEEQREIVSYLDSKCAQIDRLIAIKQEKITKLEQYKRSLIYEYVTGKKEVK